MELFHKHFKFQRPSSMLKGLNSINDKKENNVLVNIIKSVLTDLKDSIKTMSENEKRIEQPDRVVDNVKEILDFINKYLLQNKCLIDYQLR